jgi:hypothetical protein
MPLHFTTTAICRAVSAFQELHVGADKFADLVRSSTIAWRSRLPVEADPLASQRCLLWTEESLPSDAVCELVGPVVVKSDQKVAWQLFPMGRLARIVARIPRHAVRGDAWTFSEEAIAGAPVEIKLFPQFPEWQTKSYTHWFSQWRENDTREKCGTNVTEAELHKALRFVASGDQAVLENVPLLSEHAVRAAILHMAERFRGDHLQVALENFLGVFTYRSTELAGKLSPVC